MKFPSLPPDFLESLHEILPHPELFSALVSGNWERDDEYLHWDRLRHLPVPKGLTSEHWWLALKIRRKATYQQLALLSTKGEHFRYALIELVLRKLHQIDVGVGGNLENAGPFANPQIRDQYLIRSLMEEAITSSQLEGAVTTREVAKEMLRSGRPPRDESERMILNNFLTMQEIRKIKDQPLTPEIIFNIHRLVTEKTLDDTAAGGRLRLKDERRFLMDNEGQIFHTPPAAEELPERMRALCDFANAEVPFIHPILRAIIVHFWLAYDHPFVDGNGRTARALFYWATLNRKYWLFEFISISQILRKAPMQYARSFLYTETDENDLTYFIVAQIEVISRAIEDLQKYIERKAKELKNLQQQIRILDQFNHRQVDLIHHALEHPDQSYTIEGHQTSHQVVYQTARLDLLDLAKWGVLEKRKRGKKMIFTVPKGLDEILKKLA